MDLSDGLADAVRQIAAASGTGAAIDAARAADPGRGARVVPARRPGSGCRARSPAATTTSCSSPCRGARADASPPSSARRAAIPITRIGQLTKEPATVLVRNGVPEPLPPGFVHF